MYTSHDKGRCRKSSECSSWAIRAWSWPTVICLPTKVFWFVNANFSLITAIMQLFGFRGLPFQARFKFFNLCIACVGLVTFCTLIGHLLRHESHSGSSFRSRRAVIPVHPDDLEWDSKFTCFFHTCFEINDCVYGVNDMIGVYVYPNFEFVHNQTQESYQPKFSDEYLQLLDAVKRSPYYQRDASKACVLIPSIDMLSQSNLDLMLTSALLNSLPV